MEEPWDCIVVARGPRAFEPGPIEIRPFGHASALRIRCLGERRRPQDDPLRQATMDMVQHAGTHHTPWSTA